jgi:hypothetical protein
MALRFFSTVVFFIVVVGFSPSLSQPSPSGKPSFPPFCRGNSLGYGDQYKPCLDKWGFRGNNFSGCVYYKYPVPWCATGVDADGNMNDWGMCGCSQVNESVMFVEGRGPIQYKPGFFDMCYPFIKSWAKNVFLYGFDEMSTLQQFLNVIPLIIPLVSPACGAVLPHFVCQQMFSPLFSNPMQPTVLVRQPTCASSCNVAMSKCSGFVNNTIIKSMLPSTISFYFSCDSMDVHVGNRRVYPENNWTLSSDGHEVVIPCLNFKWGTPPKPEMFDVESKH